MKKYINISKQIRKVTLNNPKTKKSLHWINIVDAHKDEIEYLRKEFKIELSDLRLASSNYTSQRPILKERSKYTFLIIHFPYLKDNDIIPVEVDVFISKNTIITTHDNSLKPLNDLFNLAKKDGSSFLSYNLETPGSLLYEILNVLMIDGYEILDKTSIIITDVEKIIFSEQQKKAVSIILNLKRNVINIRRIMQNHKNIFKKLNSIKNISHTNLSEYYHKLVEHTKTFWEILDNQKEMIEALDKTNESMLNYRISGIMKTLTIFSVIVFPLTLLAALFGMNVTGGMPFMNTEHGFWTIMGIMLLGSLVMIFVFIRKKWL